MAQLQNLCLESPSEGLGVWLGGRGSSQNSPEREVGGVVQWQSPCLESSNEGLGVWLNVRASALNLPARVQGCGLALGHCFSVCEALVPLYLSFYKYSVTLLSLFPPPLKYLLPFLLSTFQFHFLCMHTYLYTNLNLDAIYERISGFCLSESVSSIFLQMSRLNFPLWLNKIRKKLNIYDNIILILTLEIIKRLMTQVKSLGLTQWVLQVPIISGIMCVSCTCSLPYVLVTSILSTLYYTEMLCE